ncbi:MAG: NAD-dependent epimerase/dehydratase family protein [Sulfurimonas sp.]|jgi:nucleoside-diphosphate-sugar epimerase
MLSQLKDKKVAILGIGYIGSNILSYLKSLNVETVAITRKNIDIFEKEEFDYLINTSGNSGDFRHQLIETVESNIGLNSYILENAKIKYSYIYISSSRVYGSSGENSVIFDEDSYNCYNNLKLDYIYDGSKRLAESLLFNYSNKLNYKIAILRLSNVYGKFNSLDDATLIKKIVRYKRELLDNLSVGQNRYSTKDYIHIDDVVHNIVNVMLNIKNTDVYNLAYGKSYSLDYISKILDLNIESDETIKPIYSNISNNKIRKEFSINFKYSFEDGLKNTILQGEK